MAGINITISPRSQEVMRKYLEICGWQHLSTSVIDLEGLMFLLDKGSGEYLGGSEKLSPKAEFILASLHTELLHDLLASMNETDVDIVANNQNTSGMSKIKFALLIAAGILVAVCEVFDGVITVLSIFSLSPAVIIGTGIIISLLSIAVFCGVDLVKISSSFEMKLNDAYKLLDTYLLQLQYIKAIRRKIDEYCLANLTADNLGQLERILAMLQIRFGALTEASKKINQELNGGNVYLAKKLISGASALLFFGGGFFASQSVALYIFSLVMTTPVTVTFWPIIVFSSIVGLAALSLYWYVERPELNKLISHWFGLNEENVGKLCDADLLAKEEKKLGNLKEKIISTSRLVERKNQLEQKEVENKKITDTNMITNTRSGSNFCSFFKSAGSLTAAFEQQNSHHEATWLTRCGNS